MRDTAVSISLSLRRMKPKGELSCCGILTERCRRASIFSMVLRDSTSLIGRNGCFSAGFSETRRLNVLGQWSPLWRGATTIERQATILNIVRMHVAKVFPQPERWDWNVICEVFIDRLEGSRRAIKGTLFEVIVRRQLAELFEREKISLSVKDGEIRLGGETYDVSVVGKKSQILIPVKTRETMGGGHALLFTRDIHKSISAATAAGYDCLPIVIAESWVGDLTSLESKDFIYIPINPNQVLELEVLLAGELDQRAA